MFNEEFTDVQRFEIDNMSYYDMLRKWRYEPSSSGYFQGARGDYFSRVMVTKRDADPAGAVQASKDIGWY